MLFTHTELQYPKYLAELAGGSGTGGLRRNSSTTSFTTLPRLEWTTNCTAVTAVNTYQYLTSGHCQPPFNYLCSTGKTSAVFILFNFNLHYNGIVAARA